MPLLSVNGYFVYLQDALYVFYIKLVDMQEIKYFLGYLLFKFS